MRSWCDCCGRQVDVVGTSGVCLGCYLAIRIGALVAKHSKLSEDAAFDLAKIVHAAVLEAFIQRLRAPGQEHPLELELEQWMAPPVDGARLFFDVEGAGLIPDGPQMRAKPTLLLLHGGPGFDHALYKPALSALADVAQVVYLDHRGNGRSSAMGRRRARVLRCARYRETDGLWRVFRRHSRSFLRHATP